MLVNKVPLSRIVDMLGISWSLLYHRIDYIHAQCMQFAGNQESKLSTMDIERLNISIDRQDHVINWSERKDKRNVVLSAITSVDNTTHYVFGVHPNFDGNADKTTLKCNTPSIEGVAIWGVATMTKGANWLPCLLPTYSWAGLDPILRGRL